MEELLIKKLQISVDFLEKLQHGDCILADRGFTIAEELATRGAYLKIPSFTKDRKQMPAKDVDNSRKISNVRIHIE